MLDYILLGNLEHCRLEAEISDGDVIAILSEDETGWHIEQTGKVKAPKQFVEQVKTAMQTYVNRKGHNPPENASRGELSLWLMAREDGTAMGLPYLV